MKKSFAINWNVFTFTSSINVQSNVNSIIHFKDTPRRSVATLSLGTVVDRASEPGAIRIMDNRITHHVKWKQLTGFPEYFISNTGIVRRSQSIITPRLKTKTKYKYVLVRNFETNFFSRFDIHRLVWEYFGNTPKQKGYEIHHKDFDFNNNHIDNLEYLPKATHLAKHGRKLKSAA